VAIKFSGVWVLIVAILAACGQVSQLPTQETILISKRLATLEISPTPNAAQVEATQLALQPSLTPQESAAPPSATPYIGVFLGEAEEIARDDPIINPALFGNTLLDNTATPLPGSTCVNQPDAIFGTTWQTVPEVRDGLGCPTELLQTFAGSMQLFERGLMYFRPPTGEIWAIVPSTSAGAGRFWYVESAPESEQETLTAPEGLLVPTLGFGAVWQGVPGVRDALGFARLGEQGGELMIQRFEGGMLLLDRPAGEVFALIGRSEAYGPFSADGGIP